MRKIISVVLYIIAALVCCVPVLAETPGVKIISKPIYSDGETGMFSEGLVWVKSNDSFKYLDENGAIVIDSLNPKKYFEKSSRIVSVGDFHEGLALVSGNEYGDQIFIDKKGNKVFGISGTASMASPFREGMSLAYDEESDNLFLYDKNGKVDKFDKAKLFSGFETEPDTYNIVDPPVFHDGLITVQFFLPDTDETLFGYFDKDLNAVIKPQFDYALPFDNGVAFVQKAGKFGLINREGEFLTDPQYEYVLIEDPYYNCTQFNEDLAIVSKDGKFGFLDRTGKEISEFSWDNARHFSNGYCAVEKDGKYGYVDSSGKTIIEPAYDDANYFVDGIALVGEEGIYRLINEKGESVSYEVWKFGETSVSISNPAFIKYKLDGKWGFAKILPTGVSAAPAAPSEPTGVKVIFRDKELTFSAPIINRNGSTMYPFRECLEAFGATVSWHAPTSTATAKLGNNTISFIVGSDEFMLNGRKHKMENGASSFTDKGVTYIPIRYAAEGLGFSVNWDAESSTITIDDKTDE